MTLLSQEPIRCVACGRDHIDTEAAMREAVRVGISFVHPDCEWTLRWQGKEAHEVIAILEAEVERLRAVGEPSAATWESRRVTSPPDQSARTESAADPAERLASPNREATGIGQVVCEACEGSGVLPLNHVPTGNGESFVTCKACAGTGRVAV